MNRFRALATYSALSGLMLAGCSRQIDSKAPDSPPTGQGAGAGQVPVPGDWCVQRISADPDSLNPVTLQSTDGQFMSTEISEGMLNLNNYTLKLEPLLAESWEISPDQLTYTFHLRHGVRFHDGSPFTADDVKYTFDRIMDPKVNAAFLRIYFTNIKECDVVDPYTIRFVATERYFKTLEVLGTFIKVVPKHAFDHGDPDFNRNDFGRHPIGTGPYKFVSWDTGSKVVFERNDDYWGGATHHLKRLVYLVLGESYVAAQLFKKKEIDVLDAVAPLIWKFDMEHSRILEHSQKIVYPYPSYYYVGFNLRLPMFSDIRVRHAIDLLMPRDEIIKQIYLGQYATKTTGYDPPTAASYNHDIQPTPYDPAQALQLLAAAGWKNDHRDGLLYKDGKPLRFTLLYPAGGANAEKACELIQESLRKEGIDVQLSRLEFAQLIEHVDDWKFDVVLAAWGLDVNTDPSQIWSSTQADVKNSSNFIGYKNPEADKLMAAGKLEYDDDKRAAIYRQLQKVIFDDYPVCFLINPKLIVLVSDRFQNVSVFTPRPCFDIADWWVPKDMQKYGD